MNKNVRNLTFDIARSLCMLWVIGVWHLCDYITYNRPFGTEGQYVTDCVLACFTFISGYFLGKKESTICEFYMSRIHRFYILFFIACILMLVGGWFKSISQFFYTITGLSNFILPQAKTFWYMSMLLFFYIITPIMKIKLKQVGGVVLNLVIGLLLYIVVLSIGRIIAIDMRLPFYLIFYVLGMAMPYKLFDKFVQYKWIVLLICSAIILVLFFLHVESWLYVIKTIAGMMAILMISEIIKNISFIPITLLWSWIAYTSMCAYLFHRHIYKIIRIMVGNVDGMVTIPWAITMLIITLLIAYLIQKVYDKVPWKIQR